MARAATTAGAAASIQPRRIVDELPDEVGLLPGELDLVASFLSDFVVEHAGGAWSEVDRTS